MSTPELTTPEDRLAELGLDVAGGRQAAGVVRAGGAVPGNYVYTSGQLPTVDGELVAVGKVGTGAALSFAGGRERGRAGLRAERVGRGARGRRRPVVGRARGEGAWVRRQRADFTGQPGSSTARANCSVEVFGGDDRRARAQRGRRRRPAS